MAKKPLICSSCGSIVQPMQLTRGSILIEIVLWLCFIIPGLIYSLWRLSSRQSACPRCKSDQLVPLDSPRGLKLMEDMGHFNSLDK